MKQISFSRLLTSIVLMILASAFLSYAFTGEPGTAFWPIMGIIFAVGFFKSLFGIKTVQNKGVLNEAIALTDTTYAGEAAEFMLTLAITGADTVQKGAVNVKDGIKKQYTIPRIDVSGIIQKRAVTPANSVGTVTVDGKTLVPQDLMLYYEFNPRDFEAHWYSKQLAPKLIDAELPVTIENYMMMLTMQRLNEWFESAYWRSRTAYGGGTPLDPTTKGAEAGDAQFSYFDGLIKKALADAKTIKVASPVALTSANIRSKFQAALAIAPKALFFKYGSEGLRFFVSYADQQKYEEALLSDSFKNQDSTEKGINRYKGYDVVPLAGLPENTFFLGIGKPDVDSNLWVGMNSTDDVDLQLAKLQANSELFFIKGLFKVDTQIGFNEQLVIYSVITN